MLTGPYEIIPIPNTGTDRLGNTYSGGYARYTLDATTAKSLSDTPTAGVTLPADANYVSVGVKGNGIRVRYDGTAPTSSEGEYHATGSFIIDNCHRVLQKMQMIAETNPAEVTISYFRTVGG